METSLTAIVRDLAVGLLVCSFGFLDWDSDLVKEEVMEGWVGTFSGHSGWVGLWIGFCAER